MLFSGLLALSAVIAWISYRSTGHKALMGLRFVSLAILAYVLTDPIHTFFRTESIKPSWVVLVDDSQSMESSTARVKEALTALESADTSAVSLVFRSFSDEIREVTSESYTADRSGTDLHRALSESADAYILITDGIATTGRDPLALAERTAAPVHVLAAGDTLKLKDIALLDADFPETAIVGSELAVPVRLVASGFPGRDVIVTVLENGTEIARESVRMESDDAFASPVFLLPMSEEGIRRFEVIAESQDGETSVANNRIRASVRVESKKVNVLHAIYEVHPDIETMTGIFRTDPTLEVTMQRFKPVVLDSADVLVVHGWPGNPEIVASINRAAQRVPVLFAPLPVTYKTQPRFVPNRVVEKIVLPVHIGLHPITDLPTLAVDRMPYLYGPLPDTSRGRFDVRLASSTQGFLLETSRSLNPRQAVLHAWGWFRLGQSPTDAEREWTRAFFLNLMRWLSVSQAESRMRIEGFTPRISQDQPMRFNVRLFNDSGEPQNDADVTARVLGSVYRLEASGAGLYRLDVPSIPEGFHDVEISASVNGAVVATERRSVDSGPSQVEFRRLVRDQALLTSLASRTGGRFSDLKDATSIDEMVRFINEQPVQTQELEETLQVARHPAWFVLLLVLLTAEWFWRRRVFLP
ncbi:MAG: hypothetical protein RL177_1052 [Bacteroidota bacterium]